MKKWEVYANLPQAVVYKILISCLKQKKIKHQISKAPPIYMYDHRHEQIIVKTNLYQIALIYVSADPLTRFFSSLLGTSSNFYGMTFLSIKYSKKAEGELKSLISEFYKNCPKEPWKIIEHPRFRFAFLLQLFTKLKWNRFIEAS